MDPITAINLEFVREVRGEWTREAPAHSAQQEPQIARLGLAKLLCLAVGERLSAAGTWLQAHVVPAAANQ